MRPLGIESYLGVPLVDSDGNVLGHLAVFDDRPMPAIPRRLFIFRVFAARAAAELVRERAKEFARASELERARLEQRILELERETRPNITSGRGGI
jgi:GAF domain-containing protein